MTATQGLTRSFQVWVVDDDPDYCALLAQSVSRTGLHTHTLHSRAKVLEQIESQPVDGVLLDLFLDDGDTLDLIPAILRKNPSCVVIVVSARGSISMAVDAMKQGAAGFMDKSDDCKSIAERLTASLRERHPIHPRQVEPLSERLIGQTPQMLRIAELIMEIKDHNVTVLITGESGTGKEVVARCLHEFSQRRNNRFGAINCAAIPETLLESELFGHVRGAFTDAKKDQPGIFQDCAGGTVFLDEIAEMPMATQAKLLRVLQERTVKPVGASREIPIHCHIVAATNRVLEDEVHSGTFREDLYYRLSVIRIDIPALRERREDISLLVRHLLEQANKKYGKSLLFPAADTLARLVHYDWPGNIRELQNVIERAVILNHGEYLQPELPQSSSRSEEAKSDPFEATRNFQDAKYEFEHRYLERLLDEAKGNIAEAARISGEHRAQLYRLLARHHLDPNIHKSGAKA